MIHVLVAAVRSIRNAAAPTHSNKMMIQRLSLQCGSLFFFDRKLHHNLSILLDK